MVRAVFDANVLASGIVGLSRPEAGAPGQLLRLWMLGQFTLIVSKTILYEVEQSAFASSYFQRVLSIESRALAMRTLRQSATVVALASDVHGVAPDPDDDHVLAAAVSGRATHIVTGDRMLRDVDAYRGIQLLTPREFLEFIADSSRKQ